MFADGRLPVAERYAAILADAGVVRGLIGPRETPRLWTRHILNSAVLESLIEQDSSVCDVGSGAGLPGVPLAIARADLSVTLVEPLLRRATFLEEVVADLGLTNVVVVRARAEDLHGRSALAPGFDVVTSRAVAPLDRLLGWSMPLVSPHGRVVALKGSAAADEVAALVPDLSRLRIAAPRVVTLGVGVLDEPTAAVEVAWRDPSSVVWGAAPGRVRAGRRGRRR